MMEAPAMFVKAGTKHTAQSWQPRKCLQVGKVVEGRREAQGTTARNYMVGMEIWQKEHHTSTHEVYHLHV